MEQQDQAAKLAKQDVDENHTQHSDKTQKQNTSRSINTGVTDGNPIESHGAKTQAADPSSQSQFEDELLKAKDGNPRRPLTNPQRRANRTGGGNEHNADNSPLHPHHQARALNKGGGFSPSWEVKASLDSGHGAISKSPGRSRLKLGGRADEPPQESAAVPKFGGWDESDPTTADGFTGIFEKVREEKQTSATKIPVLNVDSVYFGNNHQERGSTKFTTCWCFSGRKK